jgi:alpha-1,2-mannosyltransferase
MYAYANCLRQASFLMVNSSWTKNHVDSILQHRDTVLGLLFAPYWLFESFLRWSHVPPRQAQIVYPPCDTREMAKSPLEGREAVILSIQQFRCV